MYYVYCLESQKNAKLYIGYTDDLKRRFREHNAGNGGNFTASNKPWEIIFYEAHTNKKDARLMELFYKSGYGKEVLRKKLEHYLSKE